MRDTGRRETFRINQHDREAFELHLFSDAPATAIAPGYRADLNVIDYDNLTLHAPQVAHDLPAGGRRLLQDAEGFAVTIVSGVPVMRDGKPTGALPGKLVRGAKAAPA